MNPNELLGLIYTMLKDNVAIIWVFAISIFGGTASYLGKIRQNKEEWKFINLAMDIIISCFVGLITYYLCLYQEIHGAMQGAIVGISAHMGTRAIVILENRLEFLKRFFK